MWRFTLKPKKYEKLRALVKKRDQGLADPYLKYIGELPPRYGGEVHHVVFRSAGGPDKEENLIYLSMDMHEHGIHLADRRTRKKNEANFKKYLHCEEVEAWRRYHEEELKALYKTAEEDSLKKKERAVFQRNGPDFLSRRSDALHSGKELPGSSQLHAPL